jgi:DNA-binding GntR family transcriptional regulator
LSQNSDLLIVAPPSRVLSEHVAAELREAIIADRLKPGQRIVERDIAAAMQTSRGPVRDALLQLESEGLVVRYPHRGTFVTRLTIEDVKEIYSLRQAIESLAVDHLLKRATPADLQELDDLVQEMEDRIAGSYSISEATELDLAFHRALCRISGHSRALAAWEALRGQTRVLLMSRITRGPIDFQEQAVVWHRRLVDALRERNQDLAQRELRTHLAATLNSFLHSPAADEDSEGARAVTTLAECEDR